MKLDDWRFVDESIWINKKLFSQISLLSRFINYIHITENKVGLLRMNRYIQLIITAMYCVKSMKNNAMIIFSNL